jgi:hypothetical protein
VGRKPRKRDLIATATIVAQQMSVAADQLEQAAGRKALIAQPALRSDLLLAVERMRDFDLMLRRELDRPKSEGSVILQHLGGVALSVVILQGAVQGAAGAAATEIVPVVEHLAAVVNDALDQSTDEIDLGPVVFVDADAPGTGELRLSVDLSTSQRLRMLAQMHFDYEDVEDGDHLDDPGSPGAWSALPPGTLYLGLPDATEMIAVTAIGDSTIHAGTDPQVSFDVMLSGPDDVDRLVQLSAENQLHVWEGP